jgi:hypothetical protein
MGQRMPPITTDKLKAVLGDKVVYRYEKQRNFIAENEKDSILNGLKERFLNTTLSYLSSPEFPGRLIVKRYQEATDCHKACCQRFLGIETIRPTP